MEKKKKHKKSAASTPNEANATSEPLINEDQNQHGVTNDVLIDGFSHERGNSQTEQFQPGLQWPYTSQPANECTTNQLLTPIIRGQWHQLQNQQQNSNLYQVQQNQPFPPFTQLATPLWLAQQPGHQLSGVGLPGSYHLFPPVGTTDITRKGPGVTNRGIARSQHQSLNSSYQFGYPYPGCPGPWDSSSWFSQSQQFLPPCTSPFIGPCSYFPPLQPMPGCSSSSGPSIPRGVTRSSAKLSLKHQQLWEAQSSEYLQLRSAVGQLQFELADCKCRLTKLEADVLSLKPVVEKEATVHETVLPLSGQISKRGRPKKLVTLKDVLPSNPSRPPVRARKCAPGNCQREIKKLQYEKALVERVVDSETYIQHKNDGTYETNTLNTGSNEIPASAILVKNTRNHQVFPGLEISETCLENSSELKHENDKIGGFTDSTILSQHVDRIGIVSSSGNYAGMTSDGNFLWPPNIHSEECRRDLIRHNSSEDL